MGGGLTGLSTALFLNKKNKRFPFICNIFEKCSRPGGLCKTEEEKGFLFDYTGHLLHSTTKYFDRFINNHLGNNIIKHRRRAWIFSNGIYTKYPYQGNLYGLPKEIVTECLYGYCSAIMENKTQNFNNFHEWILANFGLGIAKHFMIPYNQKLWRRHPRELTCDWVGRFVPKPDLYRVIKGAVDNNDNALGYNSQFRYPRKGGIETLVKSLSSNLNNIHVGQEIKGISLNPRAVYTIQGDVIPFDVLVSTIPLIELIQAIVSKPNSVVGAANKLKYVSLLNINLGFNKKIGRKHWIYIPEDHLIFYRIGFPSNFASSVAPAGQSSIYSEISYHPSKGINNEWAKEKVVADLITMGLIKERAEIVAEKVIDIPIAYVIYDSQRKKALSEIGNFLERNSIFSAGRFGAWKYSTMEDAVLDGEKIAAEIANIFSDKPRLSLKGMKMGGIF